MMSQPSSNPTQRVALIARGASVAGGEVSLLALAAQLPEPWQPVLWVTEEGELAERALAMGLELVRGSWEFLSPRRPVHGFSRVRHTARELERHAIDLLHVNSPVEAPAFLLAALMTHRPSLVHLRIAYERRFLRAQGLDLADELVFNSRALREQIAWPRGVVVPNGVDPVPSLEPAQRRELRGEWGVGEGEILFGQVGQVIEAKGIDLSLRALSALSPEQHPWRLVIVGDDHQEDGAYRRRMEEFTRELGIADRVRFLGYRRDAQRLMGALDVLLCPSRFEPFGRVLIEAMDQGCPSIAARVGGIPEVLRDGGEGLLVPSEDPTALCSAAARLCADPQLRAEMGRRGRARARQEFSSRVHAERVASIYERIAAPYLRAGGARS